MLSAVLIICPLLFLAGLAVKHGSKIVRVSIITVLCLLLIKVLFFR